MFKVRGIWSRNFSEKGQISKKRVNSDLYGSNAGNESLDVDNGVAVESSNILGPSRREQDGLHARRARIPRVLVAPVLHQVLQFLQ